MGPHQDPHTYWEFHEVIRSKLRSDTEETSSSGRSSKFCISRSCYLANLCSKLEMGHIYDRITSLGRPDRSVSIDSIEEEKWRYMKVLDQRTGMDVFFLHNISDYDKAIREWRASDLSLDMGYPDDERIDACNIWSLRFMLIVDGLYIIEFLRRVTDILPIERDDPIFANPWKGQSLIRDILKLENQIPLLVLKQLLDISSTGRDEPLSYLLRPLFESVMICPFDCSYIDRVIALGPNHLLDLLHSAFQPSNYYDSECPPRPSIVLLGLIPCATRLRAAGIKFKAVKHYGNFVDINFKNGVLEMPPIAINESTISFLLNCIAYEDLLVKSNSSKSKHFSAYAVFMDLLINTEKDVALLSDARIIDNHYLTDAQLADLFNKLGKEIKISIWNSHLSTQLPQINQYYKNNWNVFKTSFMGTYFSSPWSLVSTIAAIILLLLTLVQAIFSVLGYVHPPS